MNDLLFYAFDEKPQAKREAPANPTHYRIFNLVGQRKEDEEGSNSPTYGFKKVLKPQVGIQNT